MENFATCADDRVDQNRTNRMRNFTARNIFEEEGGVNWQKKRSRSNVHVFACWRIISFGRVDGESVSRGRNTGGFFFGFYFFYRRMMKMMSYLDVEGFLFMWTHFAGLASNSQSWFARWRLLCSGFSCSQSSQPSIFLFPRQGREAFEVRSVCFLYPEDQIKQLK